MRRPPRVTQFPRQRLASAGSRAHLHGVCNGCLHFNHAGCSTQPPAVLQAVREYSALEQDLGGYEAAESLAGARLLDAAYANVATLLNCEPANVAITNSATSAWRQVFLGLPLWRPDSRIITSQAEYGSNYITYLQLQRRFGVHIEVIRETSDYDLDLSHLESLLKLHSGQGGERGDASDGPGITVVSLSHVPTSSGRVYDAEAVGALIRCFPGVIYVLDACQSVGQLPVDVEALSCHFLTATGRKYLRGPRGSGLLYASPAALEDERLEPASLDVRGGEWLSSSQYRPQPGARRYEEYEMSFCAKAGLGAACAHALAIGMDTIERRVQRLAARLRTGLGGTPGVTVHDHGTRLCGIVSFTVAGVPAGNVKDALARWHGPQHGAFGRTVDRVNVSVSRAPSTRLDFTSRGLEEVVRASPHEDNTETDVDVFLEALWDIMDRPGWP